MFEDTSGITPCGWRVVVEPEAVEEVSKGGIIIFTPSAADKEALAQIYGRVVAVGPEAWADSRAAGHPAWAAVGDRVIFGKYAGLIFPGADGRKYRVINDKDVVAVVPNFTTTSQAEAA